MAALFFAATADWTYDEPHHLEYSGRLLDKHVSERWSAARFDSKTPVSLANVLAMRAATALGARQPRAQLFAARLASVLWLACLVAATFLGARLLLGPQTAAIATIGVALDPSLIAHGSLITVDVLYALATLLTLLLALGFARAPSRRSALLLGGALGLALCAKFTAILLVAGLAFLPVARPKPTPLRVWAGLTAVLCFTALVVVGSLYLGSDFAPALGDVPLRSSLFAAVKRDFPGLRLPLPAAFLTGLDLTLATDRSYRYIVAFGRRYEGGTPFYFPVLWLFKTPALLWLLQLLGLSAFASSRELRANPALRFLSLNLLLTLVFFCLVFRTQVGYRYVLMCIPLAWILAAAGLMRLGDRVRKPLLIAVVVALAENALYWGNPLSFTNTFLWPKRDAYRVMADSNLDWAQNNDKIRGWMAARRIPPERLDPVHLLAGPNVIPVNSFTGVFDWERHRWAREHLRPTAELGHAHLLVESTDAEFDAFLETRRLRPLSGALGVCQPQGAVRTPRLDLANGRLFFERSSQPTETRTSIACVETAAGADLELQVSEGKLRFALYAGGPCDGEYVGQGQESWRRLEPGLHALCVEPLFAEDRPYPVKAAFLLRRGSATLSLVAGPRRLRP